jgi:hypothetical protein
MSNLFSPGAAAAIDVDDDLLSSLLGDDVVALIVSFMDPVEATVLSKRFLKDVEQRAEDALQRTTEKMTTHIMNGDDYMTRLIEAALDRCIIPFDHPARLHPNVPLPRRLLLIVARRISVRVVTGASTPEINGVYKQDQYFGGACMYTRQGM